MGVGRWAVGCVEGGLWGVLFRCKTTSCSSVLVERLISRAPRLDVSTWGHGGDGRCRGVRWRRSEVC